VTAQNFALALDRLLAHEGGYSNHPSDPGGPTNFGITIADYRKYVNSAATADDVRRMRIDEAKAIYRSKYWDALRCSELPSGVDYAVFDYGVNSGIGRAGKVLRRLVGLPDDSYVVTAAVLAAAHRRDPGQLARAICEERLLFLKRLKTWDVFGHGWERRVSDVRHASISLASAGGPPQQQTQMVRGKGTAPEPRIAKTAVATGGVAALVGYLAAARDWTAANPIETLLIVFTIVAVIAGMLSWIGRRHRAAQEAVASKIGAVPARA
jgi:lysozyme family protein